MVKRKLDGAVDEFSADQEIRKSNVTVHNLWKIWRPAPSRTGSYSRLADKIWVRLEILKACCRLKYSIMRFHQTLATQTFVVYDIHYSAKIYLY